eukprot:Skav224269  [mRNA]  locus=scaffold2636:252080:257362:- [translate_table: standard]
MPEKRRITSDPLADCRGTDSVLILDGGLATHIEALGENIDHALWSALCLIKNPKVIQKAHADFYESGSDPRATLRFVHLWRAHLDGFRELGVEETEAVAAMKRSIEIARRGNGWAMAAFGMDEEKLLAWHRPRAKALLEAGCDLFACETVPEPE